MYVFVLILSYPQITEAGIADLVVNNKSIEHLDLSECPNINDYCIELITANLKRLKTLRVNKCPLLTDDCLCIISLNCQYIKVSILTLSCVPFYV